MSIAIVKHLTKDHVRITPAAGYSVVVFNVSGSDVEAVVAADDGSETIRLTVAAPGSGRTLAITTKDGNVVDLIYQDKP